MVPLTVEAYTEVYAIIGDPVFHSLSPLMHNHAFSYLGYNAVYVACRADDIKSAVAGIRALNIKGASITIPHKVEVMQFLDNVDPWARQVGAVNTIVNRGGCLTGYNSDGVGAMRALRNKIDISGRTTAIIGAGGTARAVGLGIRKNGGRVKIFNRSLRNGERLAALLQGDFTPLEAFSMAGCDILINTSPVGMYPDTHAIPVPSHALKKDALVMDVIYNPLRTRLLVEAKAAGCKIIEGIDMFVHQGAEQFELWTGHVAPVEVMKKIVHERLKKENDQNRPLSK
jgi:shikimate dehydrogenase